MFVKTCPSRNRMEVDRETQAAIVALQYSIRNSSESVGSTCNEMTSIVKKIKGLEALVRCLLKENNPNLDAKILDNLMGTTLGN